MNTTVDTPAKFHSAKGPVTCDLCHQPQDHHFIDGATRMGPWANMCETCANDYGVGLGLGRGQAYTNFGGRWMKVAG
jgi:hypothetical protein